ncbi:MAG: tetratricopeptide repeat protein, partial [Phaeodactylibacter sp.]|nr:tetratricopeptide repeat protein [Phaeodactylibacter sp.]
MIEKNKKRHSTQLGYWNSNKLYCSQPMDLLFLAYADHHKNLPAIQQEANTVYSLLTPGVAQGCYSIHPDRTATVDTIGEYLNRFRDNIFLFHYSGHAGDDIFHLEGEGARAEGIAHLLGQCPKLKLVILNRCSTVGQVRLLRKAGVEATIIATHAPVDDIAAMRFAYGFYKAFAGGDTVEKAFEQGIGAALMGSSISVHRSIDLENPPIEDNTPLWGIFTMPGNQGEEIKLPGVQQLHFAPLPSPGFFFGREKELSAITRQLAYNQASAISISGGPGIGKSALCLAALHEQETAQRFGARRFFVSCEGSASANDLMIEIAKSLGVLSGAKLGERIGNSQQKEQELEERIWNSLQRGPALLAIDNAETTLVNDPSGLESLLKRLAGLPELALILTIRGEELPIGLAWKERFSLEPLDEDASSKVFLAIAEARFSGDPALPELLHELEGLPLAIVLMASQAVGEPDLRHLLARWKQQKTELLKRGAEGDRSTNIAVSIELSLESPRMTSSGLRVFRLLGQLPDGIAVSDLEQLASGDGLEGAKILATIGLARYSSQRLSALAPIREYASAKYTPDEKDWERLMIHYLTIVEKGEGILDTGGDKILAQITEELGNICRILDITLEDEATIGFKAALELGEFIRSCGLGDTSLLRKALEKARELNDRNVEAHLLSGLGDIAFVKSDYPDAESLLKEALPLYEQLKDILGQANCLRNLGEIAFLQSGHDTAAVLLEQALALYEQTEDINSKAYCLRSLGDMAFFRSDYKKARHLLGRALELFEQEEDVLGKANCLSRLVPSALNYAR